MLSVLSDKGSVALTRKLVSDKFDGLMPEDLIGKKFHMEIYNRYGKPRTHLPCELYGTIASVSANPPDEDRPHFVTITPVTEPLMSVGKEFDDKLTSMRIRLDADGKLKLVGFVGSVRHDFDVEFRLLD